MENVNLFEYFEEVKKVFFAILLICEKGNKAFIEVLKKYINKFLFSESEKFPFDYFLINLDLILKALKLNNEENLLSDFILYFLYNIAAKDNLLVTYEKFGEFDYKKIFFENFFRFFISLPKDLLNKYILDYFFDFLNNEVVHIKFLFKNFSSVISHQASINNKKFFNEFCTYFDKFENLVLKFDKFEWREIKEILIGINL
jgi:hypothetical protein